MLGEVGVNGGKRGQQFIARADIEDHRATLRFMRQIGAECLGNKRIIQPGGKRWRHLGLGRQIGENERWWHGNLPAAQQGFCRRLIEHCGTGSGGVADGRRVIKIGFI